MPATKHSKESAHPPKTSAQPRKRKAKDYPADAQLKKKMDCKGKAVEDMCGSDDEIHKNQTSEHWIGPAQETQVDRENIVPVKAKPLLAYRRDENTQNTNQSDVGVVVGRGDDIDAFIDTVVEKCNMCCQLEVQAKLDAEVNRVCPAGASSLPPPYVTDAVWVELGEKNKEGLVRWYPVCGTGVGFAIVINLEGVVEGLRAFAKDTTGEHAGEPFQAQAAHTLAFDTRFGPVKFWPPPKELNGVVACNHFEDVQTILGENVAQTKDLMDLLASRR